MHGIGGHIKSVRQPGKKVLLKFSLIFFIFIDTVVLTKNPEEKWSVDIY